MSVSEKEFSEIKWLLDQKVTELHVLYNVGTIIGGTLDRSDLFDKLWLFLKKTLSIGAMSVLEFSPSNRRLSLAFSSLTKDRSQAVPLDGGIAGMTVSSGRPRFISKTESFSGYLHFPGEKRTKRSSVIAVPLKIGEEIIGVLVVEKRKRRFTSDDIDLIVMTGLLAAIGLEKCELFSKTVRLSQHDGLTGLLNRRVFMEKLSEEFNRKDRSGSPISLVMMDLDLFKRINDTYGHAEGDKLLVEISALLAATIRLAPTDILARYGGEEFALLLVDTNLEQALCVAERIRKAVSGRAFTLLAKHPEERPTISTGVATFHGKTCCESDLIVQADKALYNSKRSGRNRTSYILHDSLHVFDSQHGPSQGGGTHDKEAT